jgi:hypothetical protein
MMSLAETRSVVQASRLTFFKEEPKEGTKWQPLLKKREPGGGEGRGSDKEKGTRKRSGSGSFCVCE